MTSISPTHSSSSGLSNHDQLQNSTSNVAPRSVLEKHLTSRPSVEELKQRHILLPTTAAPTLQAKQVELERRRTSDTLKRSLMMRPDRDTLVKRNILPESSAAPALQASVRALEKCMRRDSLEKFLQYRQNTTSEQSAIELDHSN